MRRAVTALALLSCVLAPASALAKGKEEPAKPQVLALEPVALPIVADGRLINYVFCSIRLDLAPTADLAAAKGKEALLRDDLVRLGHRQPFVRRDDYTRVDEGRVRAEVARYAAVLLGPGVVRGVAITRQTSQHLMTLPPAPEPRQAVIIP